MGRQILNNVVIVFVSQQLQMAPNLVSFVQFNPALAMPSTKKERVAGGSLREPSSPSTEAVDAAAIDVGRQLPILLVTIDIGTLQNVLLGGGCKDNMITEEERVRLGLPVPQSILYRLHMAN
jgi:hypothetical protein